MSILSKVTSVLPGGGDDKDHYLALLITYKGVQVVLWRIENSKVVTVSVGKSTFAASGNILEATAEAIDQACEPVDIDAKDVILGLPDPWISKNQILPQYFDKLKDLARDLDVTPFAFVSQNHAMINRLRLQYGTTLAGFLLNIDEQNCTLSSINGGQLVETRFIHIEDHNNNQALQKLFAYFTITPQAAQTIYVVGDPIPDDLDQTLTTLPAFGQLKPKIIQLPASYPILAIALAGAVDRGNVTGVHIEGEIADIEESSIAPVEDPLDSAVIAIPEAESRSSDINTAVQSTDAPLASNEMQAEVKPVMTVPDASETNIEPTSHLPEGFVMQRDVVAESSVQEAKPVEPSEPTPPLRAVPERAVIAPQPLPSYQQQSRMDVPFAPVAPVMPPALASKVKRFSFKGKIPVFSLGVLVKQVAKLRSVPSHIKIPKIKNPKTGLTLAMTVVALLATVGSVAAALLLTQATVTLTLSSKTVEDSQAVLVSSKVTSIDTTKNAIPATSQVSEVTGELKGGTTGKKKIGEKAKGAITLYNKTSSPKVFASGTVLTANNLSFVLDSAVTVPPRTATESASRDITIKPGKANGSITASEIGTESNMAAGTDLLFKGQPKDFYDASVATSLVGGTAKDVTVVSDADVKKVEAALAGNLKEQAKAELLQKVSGNAKVIDNSLKIAAVKQVVSKKVGDEADSFTISQTVKAQAQVYSLDDLKALLTPLANQKATDTLSLLSFDVAEPSVKNIDKNGDITLEAHYTVRLIPIIDSNKLAPTLAGRSMAQAKSQVLGISFVNDVVIVTNPAIVGKLNRLPFSASHITVKTKTP